MEQKKELLDWQKDEVEAVKEFLSNDNQFIVIPKIESRESYCWMQEFIEGLENNILGEELANAINRSRPFRRFKDILVEYDQENKTWFEFYSNKVRKEATFWLKDRNITPVWSERR